MPPKLSFDGSYIGKGVKKYKLAIVDLKGS